MKVTLCSTLYFSLLIAVLLPAGCTFTFGLWWMKKRGRSNLYRNSKLTKRHSNNNDDMGVGQNATTASTSAFDYKGLRVSLLRDSDDEVEGHGIGIATTITTSMASHTQSDSEADWNRVYRCVCLCVERRRRRG